MNRYWTLVVMGSLAGLAKGQSPDLSFWDTNGDVRCFEIKGDTLFVGGDFTHVGPFTGGLLPVDATTGASAPSFGIIDGDVNAVVSDGAGGWYVGGSGRIDTINLCNLPVGFVRHLLPDHSIDPLVQVNGDVFSYVSDLALWNDALLIGGEFDTLNAGVFHDLASFNTTTHTLSPLASTSNGRVESLELVGSTLYVGGDFSQLGDSSRVSLGALDLSNGSVLAWHPIIEGPVHSLAANGSRIYIGGEFLADGGMSLEYLMSADQLVGDTSGSLLDVNSLVNTLCVSGDTLFVGGQFTEVLGEEREYFAAIDLTGPALLPLDLGVGNAWNSRVLSIGVTPDRLYIGGIFDTVMTAARQHVAAIDRATGQLAPWSPGLGGWVQALGASGNDVLIGGRFHIANGEARTGLCAFRVSTGELLPWSPVLEIDPWNSIQAVHDMDVLGNTLFVGGHFISAEGQTRRNAAAFDISTGALMGWDAQVDGVFVKAVTAGPEAVYLGGTIYALGGQARDRIGAVDPVSGQVTPWDPDMPDAGYVEDIELWNDTVVIGGNIHTINGAVHEGVAALDPVSAEPLSWSPLPADANALIESLLLTEEGIIAGGGIDTVLGAMNSALIANEFPDDAAPLAWNPFVVGNVSALDRQGNVIYIGGVLTSVNGSPVPYHQVVAVDATTGVYTPNWLPDFGELCAQVLAIKATPTKVFLGAEANGLVGAVRRYFMVVSPPTDVSVPDDKPHAQSLSVIPNPAHDRVTLSFPNNDPGPWDVVIIDAMGRAVHKLDLVLGSRLMVERGGLVPGAYLLRVARADGTAHTARLVWE